MDDHEGNRQGFAAVFSRAGFQVLQAADGAEAVRAAREHRPDAILMDIGMPGMDGVQAAQAIKSDSATAPIPIIALTGQSLIRSWSELRQAGFASYLTKPCEPSRVRAEVEKHMVK